MVTAMENVCAINVSGMQIDVDKHIITTIPYHTQYSVTIVISFL
jgi:hypothetical protein